MLIVMDKSKGGSWTDGGIIVVKAHVGRWSEDCPEHSGCVVYSMADIPLGFGVVSGVWPVPKLG
jgi:hypothetical protein